MANQDELEKRPEPANEQGVSAWGFVTIQRIALIVFALLALAIVTIAVFSVVAPYEVSDPFTVPRTLAVLLFAAIACLFVAWLDTANAALIGRGMKHLLSIHRAAVATFVVAGTATIAISIFVALAALFSGEIKRGLYALAAIEFLLKLAAVSAIIVLITLRKPSTTRTVTAQQPAAAPATEEVVTVETEQEDRGRLEFGSLAFAFSLVVIAGLIVPSEDLMRLASMFFGGDKKIEDYLPQRPLVTVEDGLSDEIIEAIEDLPVISAYLDDLNSEDRRNVSDSMKSKVESVLYDLEIEDAKRLGAWPLLEAICHDQQDTLIFSNSDNKVLADHLVYLSTEGLVEYPYGDVNSIKLTQYGAVVMSKYMISNTLPSCTVDEAVLTASPNADLDTLTLTPRVVSIDPAEAQATITNPSSVRTLQLGTSTIYQLSMPAGSYRAELQSLGRADPFLQLFDADGELVGENDDGGSSGAFDARIDFDLREGDKYYLRTSSYDGRDGEARLLIDEASAATDPNADFTALQIARETTAKPLAQTAVVPPEGTALSFTASSSGEHRFAFSREAETEEGIVDLVAVLFSVDGTRYTQVATDDDSGTGGLPNLLATLEQDKNYILVLKHFERMLAEPVAVTIAVNPPLSAPDDTADDATDEQDAGTEAPAVAAPPESPEPTGSGGSQSDPSPLPGPPA